MNKEVKILRGDAKLVKDTFIFKIGDCVVFRHCILGDTPTWLLDSFHHTWSGGSIWNWRESSPLELVVCTGISIEKVLEYESL
jgi:hypothetical protein